MARTWYVWRSGYEERIDVLFIVVEVGDAAGRFVNVTVVGANGGHLIGERRERRGDEGAVVVATVRQVRLQARLSSRKRAGNRKGIKYCEILMKCVNFLHITSC